MSYKPIFKRPEDEISKKVEDKVRTEIDNKVSREVDEKVKAKVEGVRAEVDEKVKIKIEERFKEESEKVRGEVDSKVKTEVEARVLAIIKEKEEKEKTDKANRIAKAVDTAKALKGESDSEKDKAIVAEKEKVEREKAEKDILCPTCHTEGRSGHIHRAETDKSGFVYRCNDKGCGFEAILVPKDSDYKCVGCGSPIKKPKNVEHAKEMDGCPFCHGKRAIKFDWSKLWNVKK